jgi:hypothetical protein
MGLKDLEGAGLGVLVGMGAGAVLFGGILAVGAGGEAAVGCVEAAFLCKIALGAAGRAIGGGIIAGLSGGADPNADPVAGCIPNSFAASTHVVMGDGRTKRIDQIKIGDKVANSLPGAGPGTKDQTHTVTAIHVTRTDRDYTDLTFETARGHQTITGTAHHLYWDGTTHSWTPADHLHIGDLVQTTDGDSTAILDLHNHTDALVTYNLTVDGVHTYYVVVGGIAILVHNDGECPIGIHPPDECSCVPNPFQKKTTVEEVNTILTGAESLAADAHAGTGIPSNPDYLGSITQPVHDPVSSSLIFSAQVLNWVTRSIRAVRGGGE